MSHETMSTTDKYDPRWLALILRMLGTGFLLFFGIAAFMIFTRLDQSMLQSELVQLMVRLVRWGDLDGGAEHYELMVCVIYIVWGCYLWIAARQSAIT
ncbi:hypothetical protein OLMES_0488 [Oleiphilus messinensis]|uniref:Uncharacterized protein n=1 Tax=Oleiphilus messinensis TaxID=141451 RepID=A0A1Y0I2G2_9GAMM|nr:hypothetical protein [Oleiphilus messinensis]ARU54591.1 hypothetical protein OLMES_0488 [Oleiphilus messinensis]